MRQLAIRSLLTALLAALLACGADAKSASKPGAQADDGDAPPSRSATGGGDDAHGAVLHDAGQTQPPHDAGTPSAADASTDASGDALPSCVNFDPARVYLIAASPALLLRAIAPLDAPSHPCFALDFHSGFIRPADGRLMSFGGLKDGAALFRPDDLVWKGDHYDVLGSPPDNDDPVAVPCSDSLWSLQGTSDGDFLVGCDGAFHWSDGTLAPGTLDLRVAAVGPDHFTIVPVSGGGYEVHDKNDSVHPLAIDDSTAPHILASRNHGDALWIVWQSDDKSLGDQLYEVKADGSFTMIASFAPVPIALRNVATVGALDANGVLYQIAKAIDPGKNRSVVVKRPWSNDTASIVFDMADEPPTELNFMPPAVHFNDGAPLDLVTGP